MLLRQFLLIRGGVARPRTEATQYIAHALPRLECGSYPTRNSSNEKKIVVIFERT